MSERVRSFLTRSQEKVVSHYQRLRDLPSLSDADRENIVQRLRQAERELDDLRRQSTPSVTAPWPLSAAA
jgi:hypothetical protein